MLRFLSTLLFGPTSKQIGELAPFHSMLKLEGGSFKDEVIEQCMSVQYIRSEDKVLELGGNIGRNSLIIASILDDSKNLVVLESDPKSAKILVRNSELNSLYFNIVNAALSNQPLIQNKWITKPGLSQVGWFPVSTITWDALKELHPLNFTVLVADCEGALYPILQSYPQLLTGIRLVLLENDFQSKEEADFVHNMLRAQGFSSVFTTTSKVAWGPCKTFFWQAWSRTL
jgi:FkbM family methyltransferase